MLLGNIQPKRKPRRPLFADIFWKNVWIYGLLQNLAVSAVLLALLRLVRLAVSGLANQVKFSAPFELLTTPLICLSDVVWWFGNCAWRFPTQSVLLFSPWCFVVLLRTKKDRGTYGTPIRV